MGKVLGLDLGTNSIGWSIVEHNDDGTYTLIDKGVNIFKDGVAHEKSGEKPAVKERTDARAMRRHYFRRRLRKIELLKVLVNEQFCPNLPAEALTAWKQDKEYPLDPDFINWQRTDDNLDKNPYHDRYRALTEKLDLSVKSDRYCLGRALYHLNQRRGFLSNRKDAASGEDGAVKKSISDLSEKMLEANCQYLGEYFYKLYQSKGKIRTAYTARDAHVRAEFDAICEKQGLSAELVNSLERAIFFQRPLKSQKGLVGKCTFETNKPRCQVSHPRYEEFRMLSFINNIKVKSFMDDDYRQLNDKEFGAILPLFYRKSSPQFDFEDIAKKIAGKNNYSYKDEKPGVGYKFNFRMTADVSGNPVSAAIATALSSSPENWIDDMCSRFIKGDGKNQEEILNDVWHALATFGDDEMLSTWLRINLQLNKDESRILSLARIPQGYASLSLKAINKILPFLRKGYRYDEAVFLGNIPTMLKKAGRDTERELLNAQSTVIRVLEDFGKNPLNKNITKETAIQKSLGELLNIDFKSSDCLYHPSMIDIYQDAQPNQNGVIRLGSPRTDTIRNPMAMRSLFRLRILVNKLLDERKVDRETKVNIEFARGLNDSNMRAAICQYQNDIKKENQSFAKEIGEALEAETGKKNIYPTDTDILKYRLWREQKGKCLYTGEAMGLSDFIGEGTKFDIEHTIPRSRGGDDAQVNKTLCKNKFNRDVKKNSIPHELANYEDVMARIESLGWQEKVKELRKNIDAQRRRSKGAESKEAKDAAIQRMHYLTMQYDYWNGKLSRFKMAEVPEGFSNRQGVDIGIIGKYGRAYLKTVFPKVYIVKGATTAEFRKMWGLQPEYEKKERINHTHHCIDAITIACIGKQEYDKWAQFIRDQERYLWENRAKPVFDKPWPTFTQDVKQISNELLIYHYSPDNLPKQSKKVLKINGKIKRDTTGRPLYVQGDTARTSLHQQTFYGAIINDGKVKYVVRKGIDTLEEKDIEKIVDDIVRQKVKEAKEKAGNLKKAVERGIWMNEEKGIPIKKVRIFASNISDSSAVSLKRHRDSSTLEHKKYFHVANDGNYCMAIYGESKPGFIVKSNLEAALFYNGKSGESLFPDFDEKGRKLSKTLKIGTLVLLYENTPHELEMCSHAELSNRLYEVSGLSTSTIRQGERIYQYGMITMRFHQEARPSSEYKEKKGVWMIGEEHRPLITMNHSQIKCLVCGTDFIMAQDGTINFLGKR